MSMKVSVSYNINYTELNKLASKSGDVNKWMGQLAGKVTKRSKFYLRNNMVNIRTGRLISSVSSKSTNRNPPEWIISANTPYARYVHELHSRPFLTTAIEDVFRNEGLL